MNPVLDSGLLALAAPPRKPSAGILFGEFGTKFKGGSVLKGGVGS